MRLLLVLLLVLLSLGLTAQSLTSVNGTVTDPSGALIPNAAIILESTERGVKRDAVSDGEVRTARAAREPPGAFGEPAAAHRATQDVEERNHRARGLVLRHDGR